MVEQIDRVNATFLIKKFLLNKDWLNIYFNYEMRQYDF